MHPYLKPQFTLSHGHEAGMLVKINCGYCRITHLYLAADIMKICGDIPVWEVAGYFCCGTCQQKAYLRTDWRTVYGPDVATIRVRRLVGIRSVKVYDWKEGPL